MEIGNTAGLPDFPPDLPSSYQDANHQQVDDVSKDAKRWFTRPDVAERIGGYADEALTFLKNNDHMMSRSYKPDEIFVAEGPWLDFDPYDLGDDSAMADLRRTLLRRNAFAQGIAFLLLKLRGNQLIGQSKPLKLFIDDGTNFLPIEITQEMLFEGQVDPPKSGFTLSRLRNKFLNKITTNTDAIRNTWVLPMTCLGMWSTSKIIKEPDPEVAADGADATAATTRAPGSTGRLGDFSITAGVVPKIFYKTTLVPYLEHIDEMREKR